MSGLALDAGASPSVGSVFTLGVGTPLYLRVASPANGGTGALVHAASGLCVSAGVTPLAGPPAVLRACDEWRAPWQVVSWSAVAGGVSLVTPDLRTGATICLTASAVPGVALASSPCGASQPLAPTQAFAIDGLTGGHITSGAAPGVVAPASLAPYYVGLRTGLAVGGADASNAWTVNGTAAAGRLVHVASGLCLDLGRLPWSHGCLDPLQRTLPYCNPALPVPTRVEDLVARLSLSEKVALTGSGLWSDGTSSCDTVDPGVPRLQIEPKQWLVEANSMAASQCYGATCATAFPSALNLAASGNRSVWREKGRVVADEMRALNNLAWHRADGGTSYHSLNGFGP